MLSENTYSFHEVPAEFQHYVLSARKGVGEYLGATGGFAGCIHRFATGSTEICAKLPLAKSISAKEAATRFLRELRLQRSMYYHEFVHWPADFDLVYDTPIAWFRFWHCDLSALIEDRNYAFEGRLAMLAYIATALSHCHAKGLIAHQDLKPENIFIRDLACGFPDLPDSKVWRIPKLADFGSANLASECGEFGGTKAYMAPEQWNRTSLGPHTSVWSLGVIGYELLSFGEHPVGQPTRPWRDRAAGVFNRWQGKKMWLRWLNGGCHLANSVGDAEVDALLCRCLNTDPAIRPSLDEFISEVLRILKQRAPSEATQAAFRISHANDVSGLDHEWPYLDGRYNSVVRALADRFHDESIINAFQITDRETAEFVERSASR